MPLRILKAAFLAGLFLIPLFSTASVLDNYAEAKWLAVYALAAVGAAALSVPGAAMLPRLGRTRRTLCLLAILVSIWELARVAPLGHKIPAVDRASFLVLMLGSYALFRARSLRLRQIAIVSVASGAVVALFGLMQARRADFSHGMPYFEISSTFGHVNMAAEFLGLCLIAMFYLSQERPRAWRRGLLGAAAVVILAFLWISSCRSVAIGVALAAIVWMGRRPAANRKLLALSLLVAGLGLAYPAARVFMPAEKSGSAEDIGPIKSGNNTWRLEVWRRTAELIRERPLGLGVGKFEFGFLPYRTRGPLRSEDMVEKSPHNEFLRFPAEDGVPASLLYLAALLSLALPFARLPRSDEQTLLLSGAAYLGAQMLFQFPFENAVPFLFAAIGLGYVLSETAEPAEPRAVAPLFAALAALLLFWGHDIFRARTAEAGAQGDYSRLARACESLPSDWRVCLEKARMDLDASRFADAERTITTVLRAYPYHFTAATYLAILNLKRGDPGAGCATLRWGYDLFRRAENDRPDLDRYCPGPWRTATPADPGRIAVLGPL